MRQAREVFDAVGGGVLPATGVGGQECVVDSRPGRGGVSL
jgi:hypothetical protein